MAKGQRFAPGLWLLVVILGLVAANAQSPLANRMRAAAGQGQTGEFGADLRILAQSYAGPTAPGESNFFFDLWEGQNFRRLISGSGLTNNQALFVNSHGVGLNTPGGKRYALFPHESLLKPGQHIPYYSPADLVRIMGRDQAATVRNIIIGGCNEDGSFSTAEFRQYFVNVTNITHTPTGELGCQPMLLQALMTGSENVQSIYQSPVKRTGRTPQFVTTRQPKRQAIRFVPYVADLFLPKATAPFRQQIAGRELLDPTRAPLPDLGTLLAEQSAD